MSRVAAITNCVPVVKQLFCYRIGGHHSLVYICTSTHAIVGDATLPHDSLHRIAATGNLAAA